MDLSGISIVIPAYKAGKHIGGCIENLRSCYKQGAELILVENGVSEGLQQVFQTAFPNAIYVWLEAANAAVARNEGVKLASGKWINFYDIDDRFIGEKVETQWDFVQRNKEVDLVYSDWQTIYVSINGQTKESEWRIERERSDIIDDCLNNWWIPTHGYLVRKQALDSLGTAGPMDARITTGQDSDLLFQLAIAGFRFAYCPGRFVQHFRNEGMKSLAKTTGNDYWCSMLVIYERFLDQLKARELLTAQRLEKLLEILFNVARNLAFYDLETADKCHSLIVRNNPSFFPKNESRSFQLAYRALGYRGAERMIKMLKPVPDRHSRDYNFEALSKV